jgi:protein SCO1
VIKKGILTFLICVHVIVLSACGNYKFKEDVSYEIGDFTATDHRGEEVTLEQLKGEPWLAVFIFTNCTTICSPMTNNLANIQDKLIEENVDQYKIVGFSVDPENDTPEALAQYLARHNITDESKWHYVTGYDTTYIEQFAAKSFKAYVKKVDGNDQVYHSSSVYLVDETGKAVKIYTGYSEEKDGVPMDNIVVDLDTLIEERLTN